MNLIYNIMTGAGFGTEVFGAWSLAWLGLAVIFFIAVFANKWIGEFGIEWNSMFSFIGGIIGYLIIITITGVPAWSIGVGIVAIGISGFLGGQMVGE